MADKTKTIKSAPKDPYGNYGSYDRPEVSTEAPIESLYHKGDDKLAHFGILGMKWGIRRERKLSKIRSNMEEEKQKGRSEDFLTARKLKSKGYEYLSTKDLKDLTTRLQLEKQYRDLSKTEISAGKKWVIDVVGGAAKETAKTYASKMMSKGIEELIKKSAKTVAK